MRETSLKKRLGTWAAADPVCQISHCIPPSFCCWIPDGALWNGDRRLGLSHTRLLVWWAQGAPESDTRAKPVNMEKRSRRSSHNEGRGLLYDARVTKGNHRGKSLNVPGASASGSGDPQRIWTGCELNLQPSLAFDLSHD
jgi:hypothetical protein